MLNTYYFCDQTIYKFYASLVLALLGFIYGLFLLSINGFITRDQLVYIRTCRKNSIKRRVLTKASVQPKAIGSPDPCGTGYRGKIAREICDNLIAAELFNEITFLDNSTAFQDFLFLYSFFQNPLLDLENIRMRHHYSKFASNTLLEASK